MHTLDVAGKVVVVTGGSAGIGRAIAEAFACAHAKVAVIARDVDRLAETELALLRLGAPAARGLPLDVAHAAAVERAAETIEAELGSIEVWVNNASVTVFSPVRQTTIEEFRRVVEVAYLGTVAGTLAALKRMRPRDRGVIVQVGSALAYRGIPLQAAYCAAKHAIKGFQDALRVELLNEKSGVRAVMVQLPAHNTPQFDWSRSRLRKQPMPVPPIFQPELAAQAVLHAVAHPRPEYRVGWPAIKAIWGSRLVPMTWIDRYLARTALKAQQSNIPAPPDRPDNLFAPVPAIRGAHGRFDAIAKATSMEFSLRRHAGAVTVAVLTLAVLGSAVLLL